MTDTISLAPLYGAMAKAFPEIEGAAKDKSNPAFRSKYADLASVIDAVKPALANHGLWFRQVTHLAEAGVCIETLICHESGCELSGGHFFVPADKHNAHGYGSALTYAKRYSLQTTFGIPAEDDDGNAASGPKGRSAMLDAPQVAINDTRNVTSRNEPAPVTEPPKGRTVNPMSAHQAKKDGRGERAAKLANEIADLNEVTECLAWKMIHVDEVGTWPKPWQDELWGRWDIQIEGLRELAAKLNPEADAEDEIMFPATGDDRVARYARELAAD